MKCDYLSLKSKILIRDIQIFVAIYLCSLMGVHGQIHTKPETFAFILQADKYAKTPAQAIQQFSDLDRKVLFLDPSFDGTPHRTWLPSQINQLKRSGKKVIGYLSIGEAETYRAYWQKSWDPENDGIPSSKAPKFLLGENKNWHGNYRVRYWDKEWQTIVLKQLAQIINQGFDGVYLDIVDAFEGFEHNPMSNTWEDNKINPATGNTYREDMIKWVRKISYLSKGRNKDFLIIPQNGPQLLSSKSFRSAISGIGAEDVWTNGEKTQSKESINYKTQFLKLAAADKIPIYFIEYSSSSSLNEHAVQKVQKFGGSLLIVDRLLTKPGISYSY